MVASLVKILLIEDSLAEARFLQEVLNGAKLEQFSLVHVKRLGEALNQLQQDDFDVILLDLTLPDSQGLQSLHPLIQCAPSLPIVVLTNTNDDQLAIESLRKGAQDYLVKRQVNLELLVRSLRYAIERKQISEALREANETLEIRVAERTAQLTKAHELLEVERMKDEFISIVSHELRTPLTSIHASLRLLSTGQVGQLSEQGQQILDIAVTNTDRLVRLANDILDLERIESGKSVTIQKTCDAAELIVQAVETMKAMAAKHRVTLSVTTASISIWADPDKVVQILTNLLSNGIKFSPPQSKVWLAVEAKGKEVL
ncbi:MAG: response regulator [Symploca sp. SIO1C4]|uniref:histidine kinase n=1 Tax=Symploca sp. SIO1C4 TaxID=2607765 RepID=A0A6B3NGW6_9CYAN|nr:response regulator [Symploca sp. SIO1C4]